MIAADTAATAQLAPTRVRDLLAAAAHAEPADLLIDLVGLFARLDRNDG